MEHDREVRKALDELRQPDHKGPASITVKTGRRVLIKRLKPEEPAE